MKMYEIHAHISGPAGTRFYHATLSHPSCLFFSLTLPPECVSWKLLQHLKSSLAFCVFKIILCQRKQLLTKIVYEWK